MTPRPSFTVTLTPLPGVADPFRMLRLLLRYALRACGLKCIAIRTNPAAGRAADSGAGQPVS
jgi:hypothetical protein